MTERPDIVIDYLDMMRLRPPVFWKEEAAFRSQLKRWPMPRLGAALTQLLDAELRCKSSGQPAELIAARCLLHLAQSQRCSRIDCV